MPIKSAAGSLASITIDPDRNNTMLGLIWKSISDLVSIFTLASAFSEAWVKPGFDAQAKQAQFEENEATSEQVRKAS